MEQHKHLVTLMEESHEERYEQLCRREDLTTLQVERTYKSQMIDDMVLMAAEMAIEKGGKLSVMYVAPDDRPIPLALQVLLQKGVIEVTRYDYNSSESRSVKNAEIIICDEIISELNFVINNARGGDTPRMSDEFGLKLSRKSLSDNPSDRWIKPKKLRRAKGKRK